MRCSRGLFLAIAIAGCGGGAGPTTRPSPDPGASPPTTPGAALLGPLRYRVQAPLAYEVFRYDTLFYATMPGAPQGSGKRAVITVRPVPGRSTESEVRLDSLEALEDTRLTSGVVDSSVGTRWQVILGPSGPIGSLMGGRRAVTPGQIEAIVRLLFPQLPRDGLREGVSWTDSTAYRVQLDAFEASESAARTSRSSAGRDPVPGLRVEATERLARAGTAVQGGQTMRLEGTGTRQLRYEFTAQGWLSSLVARDSLEMTVAVSGQTIPVRWRSTLIARWRDAPIR